MDINHKNTGRQKVLLVIYFFYIALFLFKCPLDNKLQQRNNNLLLAFSGGGSLVILAFEESRNR